MQHNAGTNFYGFAKNPHHVPHGLSGRTANIVWYLTTKKWRWRTYDKIIINMECSMFRMNWCCPPDSHYLLLANRLVEVSFSLPLYGIHSRCVSLLFMFELMHYFVHHSGNSIDWIIIRDFWRMREGMILKTKATGRNRHFGLICRVRKVFTWQIT